MLTKLYTSKTEQAGDDLVVTISTAVVDRDGDIMEPKGVQLEHFLKSPVVLWAHNHMTPAIGKALWAKPSDDGITAKVRWAKTVEAQEIKSLYDDEILSAFSVGFIPKKYEDIKEGGGRHYLEWELLEFSAVNVPSNPEALVVRSKGFSPNVQQMLGVAEATEPPEIKDYDYPEFASLTLEEKLYLVHHRLEILGAKAPDVSGRKVSPGYDRALHVVEVMPQVTPDDVKGAFAKAVKGE